MRRCVNKDVLLTPYFRRQLQSLLNHFVVSMRYTGALKKEVHTPVWSTTWLPAAVTLRKTIINRLRKTIINRLRKTIINRTRLPRNKTEGGRGGPR